MAKLYSQNGGVAYTNAPGSVLFFAAATPPEGYLVANGAAISRTAYPELFAAIGTAFGAGDGTSTFNLPDAINKFVEGDTAIANVKAAGLPNITGGMSMHNGITGSMFHEHIGAFTPSGETTDGSYRPLSEIPVHWGAFSLNSIGFSAANSNVIYGRSTTVQPPALTLLPCIKY